MTEGERDKIHEMNGRLGGVESAVKHFKETWQQQDEAAADGRRRLHEKFEELIRTVAGLNIRVDQLTTEVTSLRPLRDAHQQNIGSKKMLAFIWAAIVTAVGAASYSAVEIAKLIFSRHS